MSPSKMRSLARFNMKAMLVTLSLSGIWLGMEAYRARQVNRVVAAVERRNGQIIYRHQLDEDGGIRNWSARKFEHSQSVIRKAVPENWFVTVDTVLLSGSDITDDDLSVLTLAPSLRALDLGSTPVTDAGIKILGDLEQLRWLDLRSTQVKDNGVESLNRLKNLEYLFLSDTEIGDLGVKSLEGLPELLMLDLTRTRVSYDAIERFRHHHPQCQVLGP